MTAFELIGKIKENIGRVMVGKDGASELLSVALLVGGHVLIEDVPGSGKTKIAKAFARSVDLSFKRLQFTPDLLPSDVTGIRYFNMKTSEFEFLPGPVFSNVLLADEINRATPKTQSGLLECMEERRVTVDGEVRPVPSPFMVIATENPVESMGVFPLPEALLDRFLIKIPMSYPSRSETVEILSRYDSADPLDALLPVASARDVALAAREVDAVRVDPDLYGYVSDLAAATRKKKGIALGVSTRGTISLVRAAKGLAAARGRDFVIPDDIKALAVPVLAHRIIPTVALGAATPETILREILDEVRVPTENFDKYKL